MTPLTSRQADILRLVLALGRPNVNDLVRGGQGCHGQSPSKLKQNLEELVGEHCLRMDPMGNEHRYTITKTGRNRLTKHGADTVDASVARFGQTEGEKEAIKKLEETIHRLSESVARLEQNTALESTLAKEAIQKRIPRERTSA